MSVRLAMYGKGRTSWQDFREVILSGKPFDISAGTFYGKPVDNALDIHMGRMPLNERAVFRAIGDDIDYVIWSYATPIAWHEKSVDVWHVTEARHSNTTQKHIGKLCGIR